MDFFEAQDHAVTRSRTLVLFFLAAVLSMIAVVYGAVLVLLGLWGTGGTGATWIHPELLAAVAGGMTFVIGTGAVVRTAQLRKGGSAVASLLGGVRVRPDTRDLAERQLLNVVEEMSIASGVPVPAVFVLGDETGINAFAAGHTIHDAAIAVTRGTLESLTRDELQGVVAHEFSHILNGDMRLNLRLMGLLYGILLLTIIGRVLARSGGGRRGRNRGAQVALLGLFFILLGYLGVFFGRLIQAAVSRQREYLADASAVQFTRNRDGIGGALKKIGGWRGSRIRDAHAAEVGHFFFASGVRGAFLGAFATHPPLEDRIRRIDPTWDGQLLDIERGAEAPSGALRAGLTAAAPQAPAPPAAQGGQAEIAPTPAAVLASVGTLAPAHLAYAKGVVDRLPPEVLAAIHTPAGASDVVSALLLSGDAELRARQLEIVRATRGPEEAEDVRRMWEGIHSLGRDVRLPILELTLPALRELSPGEAAALQVAVPRLIRADGRVLPFEFALFHVLQRHLPGPGSTTPGARRGHLGLDQVRSEAKVVLAAVAEAGSFPEATSDEVGTLDLERVDAALERLALAAPGVRRGILKAAIESALGDGRLRPAEVAVVRAIAEALDVPLPPLTGAAFVTSRP